MTSIIKDIIGLFYKIPSFKEEMDRLMTKEDGSEIILDYIDNSIIKSYPFIKYSKYGKKYIFTKDTSKYTIVVTTSGTKGRFVFNDIYPQLKNSIVISLKLRKRFISFGESIINIKSIESVSFRKVSDGVYM